jgi:hypothetical protein
MVAERRTGGLFQEWRKPTPEVSRQQLFLAVVKPIGFGPSPAAIDFDRGRLDRDVAHALSLQPAM